MKLFNIYEEASRCLLCEDAPCTAACEHGDPARAIRAIRFDNCNLAYQWIADCTDADLERAWAAMSVRTQSWYFSIPPMQNVKSVSLSFLR